MFMMTAIIGWVGGCRAAGRLVSSGGVAFPPGTPEGQVCLQDSVLISSCSVYLALSLEQWASLVIPSRWHIQRPEDFDFLLTSHPLIFVSLALVGVSVFHPFKEFFAPHISLSEPLSQPPHNHKAA